MSTVFLSYYPGGGTVEAVQAESDFIWLYAKANDSSPRWYIFRIRYSELKARLQKIDDLSWRTAGQTMKEGQLSVQQEAAEAA